MMVESAMTSQIQYGLIQTRWKNFASRKSRLLLVKNNFQLRVVVQLRWFDIDITFYHDIISCYICTDTSA